MAWEDAMRNWARTYSFALGAWLSGSQKVTSFSWTGAEVPMNLADAFQVS